MGMNSAWTRLAAPVALAILCLLPIAAPAQRADGYTAWLEGVNKFIPAVPAPGKVVIDGNLDDWDLSGEILTYDYPMFAEQRHARTALMYDAENLYVSVRFRDDTPLMNFIDAHDAEKEARSISRGWSGDALQLRINVDPRLGYPLPPGTVSDSLSHITMWYYTPRKEAQMSIERGMDFHDPTRYYSDDTGLAFKRTDDGYTLEGKLSWKLLKAPEPPRPGTVLGITTQYLFGDANGLKASVHDLTTRQSYTYQTAEAWGYVLFEAKGQLSRQHEALPKQHEVPKLLYFTYELPADTTVSMGLFNAKGTLVRTLLTAEKRAAGKQTEKWDGLDDAGQPLPAGAYTYRALTQQGIAVEPVAALPGEKASGVPPFDMAIAGERVALLWGTPQEGLNLIGATLDGQKQWGAHLPYAAGAIATDGKLLFLARGGAISVLDAASGKPLTFTGNRRNLDIPGGGISDLLCQKGHLYALAGGKLVDIALDKATVARTLPIGDGAKGLTSIPGTNSLLSAFPGGIRRINLGDGKVEQFLTAEFVDPFDIAMSPDSKGIYVSDRGLSENMVRVFTYPKGLPVGSIGRPGGRAVVGSYTPDGLYRPAGLAFDRTGRLWVAEEDGSPRRLSAWLPYGKYGKLVAEYFSIADYADGINLDPAQPEQLTANGSRWLIDYEQRTVKSDAAPHPTGAGWADGQPTLLRHLSGKTYLINASGVWELPDDYRAAGYSRYTADWLGMRYWNDLNHDGATQEIEIAADRGALVCLHNGGGDVALEGKPAPWFTSEAFRQASTDTQDALAIWRKYCERLPVALGRRDEATAAGQWNPNRQRFYLLDGEGVSRLTPTGTRTWLFKALPGMDPTAKDAHADELRSAGHFLGWLESSVGELIAVASYNSKISLVNDEGLFVAEFAHTLPHGTRSGSFAGLLYTHPKTHRPYLLDAAGGQLITLTGLDTLKRLSGPLTITDADNKSATQALQRAQGPNGGR